MNEDIVYGRNAVREALLSGRTANKMLVAKGDRKGSIGEIITLAKNQNIEVREVYYSKLDEIVKEVDEQANHQGVVLYVSPIEYFEIDDIIDYAKEKGEPPFVIVLDSLTDVHNIGAIIRSAECFGAHGIIMNKKRSAPINAAVLKASSGAASYMRIARVANIVAAIKELKDKGLWVIGADMEGQRADKVNLKGATALVIGSEGKGLARLTKENLDMIASIEMSGKVESLNASCAASILMYEKKRQDML